MLGRDLNPKHTPSSRGFMSSCFTSSLRALSHLPPWEKGQKGDLARRKYFTEEL